MAPHPPRPLPCAADESSQRPCKRALVRPSTAPQEDAEGEGEEGEGAGGQEALGALAGLLEGDEAVLRQEVEKRREQLVALRRQVAEKEGILRGGDRGGDLEALVDKWRGVAQRALEELREKVPGGVTLAQLVAHLTVRPQVSPQPSSV